MFSLTDLKRAYGRSGSRGGAPDVRPYLLTGRELDEQRAVLEAVIAWHQERVGQLRPAVAQEDLAQVVGDYRFARCLGACLQSSYALRAPAFEAQVHDVAGEAGRIVWHRLQELGAASASTLRLHVFDAVGARHGGYVEPDARDAALGEIGGELGATGEQLEALLWADAEERERLEQVGEPPTVEALAAQYNRRALETLLLRSLSADLFLPGADGGAIRRLYFAVKRAGLLCELSRPEADESDVAGVWAHLFGPLEVFGPRTRHGERFAQAVLELLRAFPRLEGSARVLINEKEYVLRLPRAPIGAQAEGGADVPAPAATFDSSVERHLFETLRGMERRGDAYGWTVEREPEAIIEGTTVLVPDFALARTEESGGAKRVFVEVIGFWTPEYRERKRAKLLALDGAVELVLVVQEALAPHFTDLPFAVLPYGRRPSAHELVTLLERRYPGRRRARPRRRSTVDDSARVEWEALFGGGAGGPTA